MKYIRFLGYEEDYVLPSKIDPLNKEEQADLLKGIIGEMGMSEDMKNGLMDYAIRYLDRCFKDGELHECFSEELEEVIREYVKAKKEMGVVDFNDMIGLFRGLLLSNKKVREEISKEWDLIAVDEGQDCTQLQFDIVKLIKGKSKLVIVGDPCQWAYGFLGANPDFFSKIEEDFGEENIVRHELNVSWRCPPSVCQLSNAITGQISFKNKTEIAAREGRKDYVPVLVEHVWKYEGIDYFVRRIVKSKGRCCVLFRTVDGMFSDNNDLIDYLKSKLEKLGIDYYFKRDEVKYSDQKVIISTIHSFKGDEAENIFIVNVSEGNIPFKHIAGMPSKDHTNSELCLLNIAATRTKKRLYMSYRRSTTEREVLSPFLKQIIESEFIKVVKINKYEI